MIPQYKTNPPKYLISIVGPTAIGKTALSILLAQHFKTCIISCDSRQFFKEMSIGTAVPNPEELAAAPHYFIQNKSIHENYSVGNFEQEALATLKDLFTKHNLVIMVGGSGMYVDALVNGLDDFPEIDPTIRTQLNADLGNFGLTHLQERLADLDPETYQTIALDNPHRVIRALEICIGTGKPYSTFKNQPKKQRPFKTISIGLNADRAVIYQRINQRVDMMMKNGLLEEVKNLQDFQQLNALQTVGYKELFAYLNNEISLDFAIEEIKKNSRRYAKRQLTWFKKNENTTWFDYTTHSSSIINHVESLIES